MFTNASDAIYYIEHIKRKEKRENLNRMKKSLALLGNPQNSFKAIHVAGTNGKGSTVCYISNILKCGGYKVGSFISPYVIKFNERIMINMEYIPDDKLVKYANIVYNVTQKILEEDEDVVTFFEFITLMGFLYFKDEQVDYAVVEVGMGGVLDATNVLDNALRCITSIGFDHMNSLGNTLLEISDKKLGIVHKNDTLITTVDSDLYPYFKNYCDKQNANMIYIAHNKDIKSDLSGTRFTYNGYEFTTPLLGEFQAYNAMLAIEAINNLGLNISNEDINKGLSKSIWPGRLQIVCSNPSVLIDGGHNIHGINAVVEALKKLTNKKVNVVFCALKDKETDKMIKKLEEIAKCFYFTQIDDSRSEEAQNFVHLTSLKNKTYTDFRSAISEAMACCKQDEIVFITGSLHFISNVIKFFKN